MSSEFVPVESSNISEVLYKMDERSLSGDLFVKFKGNVPVTYRYEAVPKELVTAFMDAPSKGKFLNLHIAPKYVNTKLPDGWELNDDGSVSMGEAQEHDEHGIVVLPSANRGGKVTKMKAEEQKHLQDRNGHNVDEKGRLLYDELCSFCHPDSKKPKQTIRTGHIEL